MPRQSNADIVYAALPEMGSSPMQVQRLAQNLPLTMPQVTAALQVLKGQGRAINPRGSRTNYWTRYEVPVVVEPPAPEPEELEEAPEGPVLNDAEARVHEVERHLARIEGALAGISSRLGELIEEVHAGNAATAERLITVDTLIMGLGSEVGADMDEVRMMGTLESLRRGLADA